MRIIALLAGRGDLPLKIIASLHQNKTPFIIIAFPGQTDPDLVEGHTHAWIPLGAIGQILQCLKANQVTHVVMAGTMKRPSWSELKLDWVGTRWLAKIGLKAFGDDSLLKCAISLLKAEGFDVLSPTDILDDLLTPVGVLGTHQPDEADWQDIRRGQDVVRALGLLDIGQAVVVQQDLVLGVEAIEGTQALLSRCHDLHRQGPGGVLVKMAKPQQSRVVDLPTIGVSTIHQAHTIGLRGIALEAGATQILDRSAVIQAADKAGLYVVGIDDKA